MNIDETLIRHRNSFPRLLTTISLSLSINPIDHRSFVRSFGHSPSNRSHELDSRSIHDGGIIRERVSFHYFVNSSQQRRRMANVRGNAIDVSLAWNKSFSTRFEKWNERKVEKYSSLFLSSKIVVYLPLDKRGDILVKRSSIDRQIEDPLDLHSWYFDQIFERGKFVPRSRSLASVKSVCFSSRMIEHRRKNILIYFSWDERLEIDAFIHVIRYIIISPR